MKYSDIVRRDVQRINDQLNELEFENLAPKIKSKLRIELIAKRSKLLISTLKEEKDDG